MNEIKGNIDIIICKTCLLVQWKNRLGFQKYRAKRHLNTKSSAFPSAGCYGDNRATAQPLTACTSAVKAFTEHMLDFLGTHPIIKYKDIMEAAFPESFSGQKLWLCSLLCTYGPFMGLENSPIHAFIHLTFILRAFCVTGPVLGTAHDP